MRIEDITEREIERWRAGMAGSRKARPVLSNKTKNHQLVLMHAICRRTVKLYGLPRNPLANVDRYRVQRSGDIEVFSPEEVWSLVRAAASEIDGTLFLRLPSPAFGAASCSGSAGGTSTSTPRRSGCGRATRRAG
jgi:hypothetical protein